jgi:hypothetical protein
MAAAAFQLQKRKEQEKRKEKELNEKELVDLTKSDDFTYEAIVIICSHSDYDRNVFQLKADGTPDVFTGKHNLCTLSVTELGTCAYIIDETALGFVFTFMKDHIFGQPPSQIMKSCNDYIKPKCHSYGYSGTHVEDRNRFISCRGTITKPTHKYCNKTYDFFHEETSTEPMVPSGGIYVLYRDPQKNKVVMVEPWYDRIHASKLSMTKQEILEDPSLSDFTNIVLLDLTCNEISRKIPPEIIAALKANEYAGGNKSKNKRSRKQNKKRRSRRIK